MEEVIECYNGPERRGEYRRHSDYPADFAFEVGPGQEQGDGIFKHVLIPDNDVIFLRRRRDTDPGKIGQGDFMCDQIQIMIQMIGSDALRPLDDPTRGTA